MSLQKVFLRTAWVLSISVPLFSNVCLAAAPTASVAAPANREQAVERVKKAVIFFKERGKEKAIEEFNDPASPFNQDGMYMFGMLFDEGGTQPIHPNLKTRGKQMGNLRDSDGKLLIKELVAMCEKHGGGWVDYRWLNKASNKIELKSSYVEKVGDMCIGTGIFTGK